MFIVKATESMFVRKIRTFNVDEIDTRLNVFAVVLLSFWQMLDTNVVNYPICNLCFKVYLTDVITYNFEYRELCYRKDFQMNCWSNYELHKLKKNTTYSSFNSFTNLYWVENQFLHQITFNLHHYNWWKLNI